MQSAKPFKLPTFNPQYKKTLLVILGPTGVGKTDISLKLASQFNCPIISSDSRQFYRELKIGTAAPTEEQLSRVPHYFIGSHSVFDEYNAGQYELDVIELLDNLFQLNNVILLVGGSMMYIDAVCNGIDNIPKIDDDTRAFWKKEYNDFGLEFIQKKLKELDPKHYNEVDLQNPKRIIHALEICSITGRTFSELRTGQHKNRSFNIIKIGLYIPRQELYNRINNRVDQMMKHGLLEEAKQFYQYRHLNTLNTVGYKELFEYINGIQSLDFAVNMIKQDTRHYAKRQLSWFNRDKEIQWFQPNEEENISKFIIENVENGV
jgi:tRNA dimethylallyltransferase